jgi:hypothetical protein
MRSAQVVSLLAGWLSFAGPAAGVGLEFFPLAPCRLVDTRGAAAPAGGPALDDGVVRVFQVIDGCAGAIPKAATAVTVNVTAVPGGRAGSLTIYPAGLAPPTTTNVSFQAARTRAANTVVGLGVGGAVAAIADLDGSGGVVDLVLDIAGYFVPVVRFAALGDTGRGNTEQGQVATALRNKCVAERCDFVVLLGDNIYDSGVVSTTDPQWQTKFELPYQNVDLDFWAVLGNHDYGGNGAGNEFTKGQHQVDYTLVSDKWQMPDNFYRQAFEHVELFALDTNLQYYGMDADQESAFPSWLAASSARWKIALGHHPYLSNGPHGNAGNYDGVPGRGAGIEDFFDDHLCGEVDVYLSGHDHSLQWLADATCAELIVSGAGAAVTTLPGSNASRYQDPSLGFLYVEIVGDSFTGQFIGADGSVLYERTLVKP